MRYLFSFIFGLCSALLYWLMRAVLLLDRLICRVYDLPIWAVCRDALSLFRRRRAACAFAAFIPLFFVPGALLMHSGTLVTADGRPLGLIETPAMLEDVITEMESSASAVAGAPYHLPMQMRTRPLSGSKDQFLSEEALRDALMTASGELNTVAVISIDGRQAGVCRTTADAQTILDRILARYTIAGEEDAHFIQQVRVDSKIGPSGLIAGPGALYETLLSQLDVSAVRAVTYTEEIPYETVTRENDQLDQDIRQTVQEGKTGEAVVTAEIQTVDGQEQRRTILERTVLSDATSEIIEIGTKNAGIGTGDLAVPVNNYTFTSGFKWRWGRLHGGVDLAVPEGTPVYAADHGKVIVADDSGYGGGYGHYIILDHQNGLKTLYAHNTELLVSVGDIVRQGDKIALSGNTGNTTGPHVHFEVRVNDEQIDPQRFITLS